MNENGTDYRDRVDRMAAAYVMSSWTLEWQAGAMVTQAMVMIDAIDKAIAEREARG